VISSNSSTEQTGETVPEAVAADPAPRPVRRSFTAAYRLAVVAEYESAPRQRCVLAGGRAARHHHRLGSAHHEQARGRAGTL